jgi:hypothetical protein
MLSYLTKDLLRKVLSKVKSEDLLVELSKLEDTRIEAEELTVLIKEELDTRTVPAPQL